MPIKINAIIVDDEALARKRVENLLLEVEQINIIAQCSSGSEAIKLIHEKKPNLIFLDIQLSDMSGFDLLEQIKVEDRPLVIFITAYDNYALKAFDFFAFDYLLKPFKDERFYYTTSKLIDMLESDQSRILSEKLNNLVSYIEKPNGSLSEFKNNMLPIKSSGKISFIPKSNIKYVQASGYYIEIHTDTKKHLLREPLSSIITNLDEAKFSRIHRSTIVNISFIKEIIYSNYGEIDVKMSDETLFRISKTYKKQFQKLIGL